MQSVPTIRRALRCALMPAAGAGAGTLTAECRRAEDRALRETALISVFQAKNPDIDVNRAPLARGTAGIQAGGAKWFKPQQE